MTPRQNLKLEVDLEPLQLVGKEREQYLALERLQEYAIGRPIDIANLVGGMRAVIGDWDRMLGGKPVLAQACEKYFGNVELGDRLAARTLYLLASPMIFYIHALYQVTKSGWRNAITSCGIFCERVLRNIAFVLDKHLAIVESPISTMKSFADKNGRVKHELEESGVGGAEDLFHLLKRIYSARSATGPHDVPPPEPLEAKVNVTLCLPLYLDYYRILGQLRVAEPTEGTAFASFMDQAARVHVQLAFGDQSQHIPVDSVIRDRLYRTLYFSQDRTLRDVANRLREEGYSSSDSVLANALRRSATGRVAYLTRTSVNKKFVYRERLPPNEYFRTLI